MQVIDEWTDRIYYIEFAPVVSLATRPRIMVSLQDVTALRRVEAALKDSERKVATLFETVPNGIIMFDAAGAILDVNPAALRILGLHTIDQLGAASVFTLACLPETLEALIHTGKATEIELACDFERMKREQIPSTRTGVAYFSVVFTPIRPDNGGRPHEFVILFKDITRDRNERKELTVSEMRYHSFFENTCNGVIIYETTCTCEGFTFKDLNRAAEEIFGILKEDLIGRSVWEVFPDLVEPELWETVQRVLDTGTPVFLPPLLYRRGTGLWIWTYLFKLPTGEIASFMIDVSDELRNGSGSAQRNLDPIA
jgi:PAS domain S-box-containing protein